MTTIVADRREGIMVSDNQNTLAGIRTPCRKIYRINAGPNKGCLVGTCGNSGPSLAFVEWYEYHSKPSYEEGFDDNQTLGVGDDDEDFWCLILTPDKRILIGDRFMMTEEIPVPYFAVGSGGNIALGAMDAGATAEEALEIACRRDTHTSKMGRKLQIETL